MMMSHRASLSRAPIWLDWSRELAPLSRHTSQIRSRSPPESPPPGASRSLRPGLLARVVPPSWADARETDLPTRDGSSLETQD